MSCLPCANVIFSVDLGTMKKQLLWVLNHWVSYSFQWKYTYPQKCCFIYLGSQLPQAVVRVIPRKLCRNESIFPQTIKAYFRSDYLSQRLRLTFAKASCHVCKMLPIKKIRVGVRSYRAEWSLVGWGGGEEWKLGVYRSNPLYSRY